MTEPSHDELLEFLDEFNERCDRLGIAETGLFQKLDYLFALLHNNRDEPLCCGSCGKHSELTLTAHLHHHHHLEYPGRPWTTSASPSAPSTEDPSLASPSLLDQRGY